MSTLYYTFGVGTAAAMREQLAKMKQSEMLVCIIPPKEYLLPVPKQNEEDIKAVLSDTRIILIGEQTLEQALAVFKQRVGILQFMDAAEYLSMDTFPVKEDFPKQKWMSAIDEHIRQSLAMAVMLFNTSRVSVRNYFLNAFYSLLYQNWDSVVSKIGESPVVIVGMGPSMAREIPTLKRIRERVVLVAVDNSLRYLAHHGIYPDFALQVEWQDRSLDFYHGVDIPDTCTLVALAGVSPETLHFWKGPKLIMPNYQIHGAFDRFVNTSTDAFFGSNVGTLAIQFANRMRVRQAWLVGFDFGSPQASYFHPGSVSLHEVYPTVTRFWSPQKMDFNHNRRQQETITVEDRNGNPMWTATSFESDRRSIEQMISTSKTKFFNTSTDGRPIAGAEYRTLEGLTTWLLPRRDSYAPDPYPLDLVALIETCATKHAQLTLYEALSDKVYKAAESALALHERGHRTDTALRNLSAAIDELQKTPFGWIEGIMAILEPGIRHVFLAETIAARDLPTKSERLLAWAKVIREFYPSFARYNPFISQFLVYTMQRASLCQRQS